MWDAVKADGSEAGGRVKDTFILTRPVELELDGYVFLDGIHARKGTNHDADVKGKNVGRGMSDPRHRPSVRRLWEVYPVYAVRLIH